MPRNGAGTYTQPANTAAVSGQVESSVAFNTLMTDFGTEITNSLDRAGRSTMSAPLVLVPGTVAAPGLAFSSDTGTGVYHPAVGAVGVAASGALQFTVNTNGVGIGSVAPTAFDDFFHIELNQNTSTSQVIYNRSDGASSQAVIHLFSGSAGGSDLRINTSSAVQGAFANITANTGAAGLNIINTAYQSILYYVGNLIQGRMNPNSQAGTGTTFLWENCRAGNLPGIAGTCQMVVSNQLVNASAAALFTVQADTAAVNLSVLSSTAASPNQVNLRLTGAAEFAILNVANSPVSIYTNNTLRFQVTGAGVGSFTAAVTSVGAMTSLNATATTAAASAIPARTMGSAGIADYFGTGSPNGALVATKGSMYRQTDGSSASTRLYINSDGNTAWVSLTASG